MRLHHWVWPQSMPVKIGPPQLHLHVQVSVVPPIPLCAGFRCEIHHLNALCLQLCQAQLLPKPGARLRDGLDEHEWQQIDFSFPFSGYPLINKKKEGLLSVLNLPESQVAVACSKQVQESQQRTSFASFSFFQAHAHIFFAPVVF